MKQPGFAVPRQRQLYILDVGPRKRVCLVLDPPPTISTEETDVEPAVLVIQPPSVTGFFSVRHRRARVSYIVLEPIAEVVPDEVIPAVVDTTPEDYFAIPPSVVPTVAELPVEQAQGASGGESTALSCVSFLPAFP